MDFAAIQAQKLFTIPAKTGRINIHNSSNSNRQNVTAGAASSSASKRPSSEVIAFLEQAERRGIQRRQRYLSKEKELDKNINKNQIFVVEKCDEFSDRRHNDDDEDGQDGNDDHHFNAAKSPNDVSRIADTTMFASAIMPKAAILTSSASSPPLSFAPEEKQTRRSMSIASDKTSATSISLDPVPINGSSNNTPPRHRQETGNNKISQNSKAAARGLASASVAALKRNEEVLRHDEKKISFFDPPRPMKNLDRTLNAMTNDISKLNDGRKNHFLVDQLKVMEEVQIQLQLRKEREIRDQQQQGDQEHNSNPLSLMNGNSAIPYFNNNDNFAGRKMLNGRRRRSTLLSDYSATDDALLAASNPSNIVMTPKNKNGINIDIRQNDYGPPIQRTGTFRFGKSMQLGAEKNGNSDNYSAVHHPPSARQELKSFTVVSATRKRSLVNNDNVNNNVSNRNAVVIRGGGTSYSVASDDDRGRKHSINVANNNLDDFSPTVRLNFAKRFTDAERAASTSPSATTTDVGRGLLRMLPASFKPLPKPPLQSAAWSKHLSHHTWDQLTPRTRHLAEVGALQDVSHEDQVKREGEERKGERTQQMLMRMMRRGTNAVSFTKSLMLKRQNTMSNNNNTANTRTNSGTNNTSKGLFGQRQSSNQAGTVTSGSSAGRGSVFELV